MTSENHLFLSETNQLKGKIIQQRFEENYKHKKKSTSQRKFTQVNSMFEEEENTFRGSLITLTKHSVIKKINFQTLEREREKKY